MLGSERAFGYTHIFGVVAIPALAGAIDGGITAFMSEQDFWKGFAAGTIGGAMDAFVDIAETELLLAPQSSRKIFNYNNETVTVVNYIYPNT